MQELTSVSRIPVFPDVDMEELLSTIDTKLSQMDPISLEQMSGIKLMNRIDTKYLVDVRRLPALLDKAKSDYFVQEIAGKRKAFYRTLYWDTADAQMYIIHHDRKLNRQKIRVREYVESNLTFLEIKNKSNKGRTKKIRISVPDENIKSHEDAVDFINKSAKYGIDEISGRLRNQFSRITLVNKGKTERLTIDISIKFENCVTGNKNTIPALCIVEVKRDGNVYSPFTSYMADCRIKKKSISKYCLGMILTDPGLKKNRFKMKLRYIEKMLSKK